VTELIAGALPRPMARITGVVYLLAFLMAALFGFITPGTPSAIVAHEPQLRLGIAVSLIWIALYIALTALFYRLFEPVNRSVALLLTFFSLVGCTIQVFASVFLLAPLVVLGGGQYFSAFTVEEMQALAQMLLDFYAQANNIAVIFLGLFDILVGYLIFRSTFLPRILGALMAIGGLGWLIFLSPPLANHLAIYIDVPGVGAQVALILWLLAFGVNVPRWREQAIGAGMHVPASMHSRPESV
jgi:hypothetical protein